MRDRTHGWPFASRVRVLEFHSPRQAYDIQENLGLAVSFTNLAWACCLVTDPSLSSHPTDAQVSLLPSHPFQRTSSLPILPATLAQGEGSSSYTTCNPLTHLPNGMPTGICWLGKETGPPRQTAPGASFQWQLQQQKILAEILPNQNDDVTNYFAPLSFLRNCNCFCRHCTLLPLLPIGLVCSMARQYMARFE